MKNSYKSLIVVMTVLLSIFILSCGKVTKGSSDFTEIQKRIIMEDRLNVKNVQSAKDYLGQKCNNDYNDSYYLDSQGHPQGFDCSTTPLTDEDVKYMAFFPNVTDILITGRDITDKSLEFFIDFYYIRGLFFKNTSVTGVGFTNLKKATKLEVLNFSGSPITDEGCRYLSEIKLEGPINEAMFNNTKITDKGLSYLSKLQFSGILMLNDTVITDEGLKYLANQKDLQELWIINTNVTTVGVQWLQKELPRLSIWLERME